MPKLHLYFHIPVPVFKARVNMSSVTYPVSAITFDGVTLGSFSDIEFDSTILLGTSEGADDLGRSRIQKPASSSSIPVMRSSKGFEDGQLDVQNNAYITVLDDFRVWARLPYYDLDNGLDFKDGDVEVGSFNTNLPPIANCGSYVANYIDPITSLITVQFPNNGVNLSRAMADGATIASYEWDVKDGTITVGTSASAVITATFPAGFRYVALTVVDTNGVPHTSRCAVLAVDPANDTTIKKYQISQRLEWKGSTLDVNIHDEMSRADYPDGTLVMFWWDAPVNPGDRDHMKFVGWVSNENYNIGRDKKGVAKRTTLHCVDVCGRLAVLPGFPQAISRIEDESPWSYMPSLDMNKSLWYLGFWHGTAINLADFILPSTGDDYNAMRLDASGASLFEQMSSQAQKMVPDYYLCCNAKGQMIFQRDWRLDDIGDRPTSAPIITEDYWNDIQIDYNRHPKVYVLRSGAILSSTELDENGEIPLVFSIAPSDAEAFGQGVQEQIENEGLALSQAALNKSEGHRYAMLNNRYGDFTLRDPSGFAFWDYEPAAFNRVQLNIPAALAAQRGLDFTQASGLIKDITVQYETSKRGTVVKPSATWNKETSGYSALTHIPEDVEDVGYVPSPPVPYVPPAFGDPGMFYDNINAYVVWDGTHVGRTWDLQAATPTWENISGSLTGDIYDGQYVNTGPDTVGMWLLTSTAVWWCADIMAVTPVWTAVLTLSTVQAADETPADGTVEFKCMAQYWTEPGFLCVATGPTGTPTTPASYLHAYFWHTHDYGQSWIQVDMDAFTFTSNSITRCYSYAGRFAMEILRSAPGTIWCLRTTSRTSTSTGRTAVFKSEDLGHTWTMQHEFGDWSANQNLGSLLHPFPSIDDPAYIVRGATTSSTLSLYISTDAWATATLVTPPSGHSGGFAHSDVVQRANKRTFDNTHIINIMRINASTNGDLYESFDQGASWSLLDNLNNSMMTPNGWPPDVTQWVLVDREDEPRIQLTLDNFATMLDKSSNIATVFGTWTLGLASGFALPKVGPNI